MVRRSLGPVESEAKLRTVPAASCRVFQLRPRLGDLGQKLALCFAYYRIRTHLHQLREIDSLLKRLDVRSFHVEAAGVEFSDKNVLVTNCVELVLTSILERPLTRLSHQPANAKAMKPMIA
jgi:hypothetical protein